MMLDNIKCKVLFRKLLNTNIEQPETHILLWCYLEFFFQLQNCEFFLLFYYLTIEELTQRE